MRRSKIFALWATGRMTESEAKQAIRESSDNDFFRADQWGLGEMYDDGDYLNNLTAMENMIIRSEPEKLKEFLSWSELQQRNDDDKA